MAKSSNQKLKILYLLDFLRRKTDMDHSVTMQEIISYLESQGINAERKSIYDDFEALRNFGFEVEKNQSKSVGYYLAERDFELPELKLLVDAVQSSKFITKRKSEALIRKIESLASENEASELQSQVYVTNRIKTMNESIYYAVDFIHQAIAKNKKISYKYYDWNREKQKVLRHDGKIYRVSPWALTWDDENYYMVGYDDLERKIKHYRVDKMMNLNILDERRDGAEVFRNFDMAIYSKKTFGMYGGEEKNVGLICKNHLAGAIIDRFGEDVIIANYGEDHFKVTVKVLVSPLFLTWIMNFGGDIVIDGPADVQEKYVELAKKVLEAQENINI